PFAEWGKSVLLQESHALQALSTQIDERFAQVCQMILSCKGRIIVIGLGKSGHIGRKITATLCSTGSPACFMHATEAGHVDLGMVTSQDRVIALSHSGETLELLSLLPMFKDIG